MTAGARHTGVRLAGKPGQGRGARMNSCKALVLVVGLLLTGMDVGHADTPVATSATPGEAGSQQFLRQRLASAHALARANNYANADRVFAEAIADPLFPTLPEDDQRNALSEAARMAARHEAPARARDLYERAAHYTAANPDDWYALSFLEYDLGHYEAAATAFIEVVERWPDLLPNVEEYHIHRLHQELSPGSQAELTYLQSLFDANWRSKWDGDSRLWYDLAVIRADRGEIDALRTVVRRIDGPAELVKLRSDKRFDAVIDAGSPAFDPLLAAREQVGSLALHAEAEPENLELHSRLSNALLAVGMHDSVIELADASLQSIADAPADAPAYQDIDEQVWLMNNRAIALRRLGRTDDALTALVRASQLSENGGVNVSQALNLGAFYCSLEQPHDALRAISSIGDMVSSYGRMIEHNVRLCAAQQLQRRGDARRAMAYLRRHRTDGHAVYLDALLRAGDLDAAAHQVVERLASAERRGGMLEWMQGYLRPDVLPGDANVRAARASLLARRDVQDAVTRVGRIASYAIYQDDGMD
ncbi:hypothetical protein HIV01_004875 [Lysobacter arenosi]|uniref:Tetratricopeptide repeat protein n=1 Tax=Lysobacter arenosi TaxID=2795387 RepID=A0ABX7RCH4_9GAMM|nr:hypothetical protein [Lysobacter arenosi]QSX75858.1 hypothetical protein HIV01_004875 [Lysobacter arenosi]